MKATVKRQDLFLGFHFFSLLVCHHQIVSLRNPKPFLGYVFTGLYRILFFLKKNLHLLVNTIQKTDGGTFRLGGAIVSL